jgi:hypothetical protein
MSKRDTLFSRRDSDAPDLLWISPQPGGQCETLFSVTDIASLNKQFGTLCTLPSQRTRSALFGDINELQRPSSPASSILSLGEEVTHLTEPDDDDPWPEAHTVPLPQKRCAWETFGRGLPNSLSFNSPFLTEQNPKVFDALLRRHLNHIYSPNEAGIVVDEVLFREVLPFKAI